MARDGKTGSFALVVIARDSKPPGKRAHPGSNPAVVVRDTGLTTRDMHMNELINRQQGGTTPRQQGGTTRLYPPAAGGTTRLSGCTPLQQGVQLDCTSRQSTVNQPRSDPLINDQSTEKSRTSVPWLGGIHPAGGGFPCSVRAIAPGPTGEGGGVGGGPHRPDCASGVAVGRHQRLLKPVGDPLEPHEPPTRLAR